MEDQQYKLKSYVLFFKSAKDKFQYRIVSAEEKKSFKGSLLESLLSDKERFSEGNLDSQNAFEVRIVVHSHKDFSKGQVSKEEDVATFAQEFFLHEEKKEYLPIVHITLDDSYVYNLYNLSGSISVGGKDIEKEKLSSLRDRIPSRVSRSYQILDSSIWNNLVPFESIIRKVGDKPEKLHIAGGSEGLYRAISEIETNVERGLYSLGVAKEYANLNARLTQQAFLSGAHASGVSPFIFHSESATNFMIEDEFKKKEENDNSIIEKIADRKWRVLLVDDKAHSQMDSKEENTSKAEDGLYNNCKLRIIKNLFEDQFGKDKVEWRSCKHGFKDPALYIWFKGKSCREVKEQIIKLFEKDENGKKINFTKECLHEIEPQTSQENNNTSQDGNKNCETGNCFYGLLKSLIRMMSALFVKKEKEDSSEKTEKNEDRATEGVSLLGYKYVGEGEYLQKIKDKIDSELNNIFWTEIEKDINDEGTFLIEYAETLEDAEKALQTKKYDFILLDYLLNNEYGYELLDRIYCYRETQKIFDETDWDKDWDNLANAITCDNPSGEYDELLRYLSRKKNQKNNQNDKLLKIKKWIEEIDKEKSELKDLREKISNKNNKDKKEQERIKEQQIQENLKINLLNILEEDKYKFGPHERFYFMFISAYTSAVYERLLAEGLNRNEKYWYIAVGACPTNTPKLFMYNLLKLMEKQLVDSGITRMSPREIYKVADKIYGGDTGKEEWMPNVRKNANDYYQEVLNLQYRYKKMLADVDIPRNGGIFNTNGSVLITDFIKKNVNLGGFLEHFTQMVHLTAFGTVRQWHEIWEEYIYFKSQFNISEFKDNKDKEKFYKLCVAIEKYVIALKEDIK